jgi:hypothetical protein
MKKLLLALFTIVCVASFAMAKDGPFPIESAVGTWVSENGAGLKITIAEVARSANVDEVMVRITNSRGEEIARGVSRHRLSDSDLLMNMINASGRRFTVRLRAVDSDDLDPSNDMKLVLDLGGYYGDDSPQDKITFHRR